MTDIHDVILNLPSWLTRPQERKQPEKLTIIFFITGNPALIGYYDQFLQLLASDAAKDAVIAGASLAGFESDATHGSDLVQEFRRPPGFELKSIYDLQDQISLCEQRLHHLITKLRDQYSLGNFSVDVILIGHSLGTYIALELLNRHFHSYTKLGSYSYTITATMLLTATIYNLSASSSGRIAAPLLGNIPFFPALVQILSSTLTNTLPTSYLKAVISKITGMSGHGLDVTARFLQTPGAVKEALHLAKCELAEIGEDRWVEEIWDATSDSGIDKQPQWRAPKHFILFAGEDHWVANETREVIKKKLGKRIKVMVDEKVVHAWCLAQSEYVAEIVNCWLWEVL